MMGIVALERGDLQAARTYLQQSAHKLRELGDRVLGYALGNLGIVELHLGNYKEAAELQQEALEHFQKWEDVGGIAFILLNLGRLARLQQNFEEAHALCQQSLTTVRQTQETRAIAYASMNLALSHWNKPKWIRHKLILRRPSGWHVAPRRGRSFLCFTS